MKLLPLLVCFSSLALCLIPAPGSNQKRKLEFAATPPANPLKGLVPYEHPPETFPCSMEFNYLPVSACVKGEKEYDWKPLEKLLDSISGRRRQAVVRFFLEYPGKKNVIPQYLVDKGLKVHKYINTNTAPLPPTEVETPDYQNSDLRQMLKDFIAAFGKKYDGDPRLGYITAGLLGTWGEWHTYPKTELWASKEVQTEVLDAYQAAFKVTPVLLRYPAGEKDYLYAPSFNRPFGYHDDSFCWATLHTGKKDQEWFFESKLREAKLTDKWKTQPIGGEIRPEVWGKIFDKEVKIKEAQDFTHCVEVTHATWLMDTGMYQKNIPADRKARAIEKVRRMGYDFHIPTVEFTSETASKTLDINIDVENRGVAPFYYDWKLELGLLGSNKKLTNVSPAQAKLNGLLPGDPARTWKEKLPLEKVAAGKYQLLLRVVNPLKNGLPLHFANQTQNQHLDGWLSLGEVTLK